MAKRKSKPAANTQQDDTARKHPSAGVRDHIALSAANEMAQLFTLLQQGEINDADEGGTPVAVRALSMRGYSLACTVISAMDDSLADEAEMIRCLYPSEQHESAADVWRDPERPPWQDAPAE